MPCYIVGMMKHAETLIVYPVLSGPAIALLAILSSPVVAAIMVAAVVLLMIAAVVS
jgi:hypothetical protein